MLHKLTQSFSNSTKPLSIEVENTEYTAKNKFIDQFNL